MPGNEEMAARRAGSPGLDSQLAPGTVLFGEYEISGVLGGGGMGWVYRARHRSLGDLRAIKVIRPDLAFDSEMEQMFVSEAGALTKVHHDAVVRCHDLLRDEQRIYLVMELVQGPSLVQYLAGGPMRPGEVRALRRRLAGGLAAAHACGVVHRDVSPENIILADGKAENAKLIDFGVAKVEAAAGPKRGQSMFKGKFAYASPEQCGLFGGRVDARSDIYSLGLVLAEAASGAPLPMGDTFYEAIEMRKVLPRIPPAVPRELADEILPLLEPDPDRRPQSAQELTGGPAPVPRTVEEQAVEAAVSRPGSPVAVVIFTASAVGAGVGLGFVLWVWKTLGR